MRNFVVYSLFLSVLITACGPKEEKKEPVPARPDSAAAVTTIEVKQDSILPDNGIYEKKYDNGQVSVRGEMHNSKREGVWLSYYKNGQLWSQSEYVNGLRNGKAIAWYPNGQKRFEGTYTDDKQTGIWKFWEENGKLAKEVDYDKSSQ